MAIFWLDLGSGFFYLSKLQDSIFWYFRYWQRFELHECFLVTRRTNYAMKCDNIYCIACIMLLYCCLLCHSIESTCAPDFIPQTMESTVRVMRSFEIRLEFEPGDSDSIRKWRADLKFLNQRHLPSYHKPHSLFNKKLQRLRRCNWDLFYVCEYCDFMFL